MLNLKISLRLLIIWAKYDLRVREIYSFLMFMTSLILIVINRVGAANLIMIAHRNTRKHNRHRRIEAFMKRFDLLNPDIIKALIPTSFRHKGFYHGRVFKLKEKQKDERGVALLKYNETFSKMHDKYDFKKILNDYFIVLEPSYSGYCTAEILQFLEYRDYPIVIQAAEKLDFDFIERLNSNLLPVNIGSSDWVDDRVFTDLNLEKEYDCIIVAMWNDIKRHHVLMRAIKRIADPSYKACLLGGPWGRVLKDLEEMANYFGVRKNIDFFERLSPDKVNILLNKSKVNLLLTLKEGANKVIFEGFFADVPGIVLKNNIGVNKKYFNDQTGVLINEKDLADTLTWFRTEYSSFSPRKWALENISSKSSTAKIEEILRKTARKMGENWNFPLAVKVNRPECEYYDEGLKLTPFDLKKYHR